MACRKSHQQKFALTVLALALSTSVDAANLQLVPITVGSNQGSVLTSTDNAATWQYYDIDQTGTQLNDILWANNQFVGVGESGGIFSSPDGANWSASVGYIFGGFNRVIFANKQYLAMGDVGLTTSPDGVTWTGISIPNPTGYDTIFLNSAAWGNGHYVMVGSYVNEGQKKMHRHLDAKTFKSNDFPTYTFTAISTDAVNWTLTQQQPNFSDILWDNHQFVAVSYDGVIATSPDGVTWTTQHSDATQWLKSMVYANGTYVVLGQSQNAPYPVVLLTSKDAKTWTSQSLPVSSDFSIGEVKFKNLEFVVVGTDMTGSGGQVFTSRDAVHWTVSVPGTAYGIYSVG